MQSRYTGMEWTPAVDIYETADNWLVFVELPGMTRDDVDLTVFTDSIVLKGMKKPPARELAQSIEIYTGWFRRKVVLPGKVRVEDVKAAMKNGLLAIVLPRKHPARRRIEIKGGGDGNAEGT